jgi:WD40 repeat protein
LYIVIQSKAMEKNSNLKRYVAVLILTSYTIAANAQQLLDYQLRLEPVWSRVADALGEIGSVESAEFSPDGKFIVSGTKYDNSVVMWRTSDGVELWRQKTKEEIERVGWSADGKLVAAASEDFVVTVYDAGRGDVVKVLRHEQGIDGLTWSHKGGLLVTGEETTKNADGSTKGIIRIFDMPAGKPIKVIDFGSTVNRLAFTVDDQYLLAVGHADAKIYRVADWSVAQTLKTDQYVNFASGAFSPDGEHVVAAGTMNNIKGNVFIWNWKSGKLLKHFNHTGKKIESITWHPNGKYIVHVGHDPYIYVYRVADILKFGNDAIPVAHKTWASDHAEYIDFNADGSFMVSAHQNGLIKLWVWMGEDSDLNAKRHQYILKEQAKGKE